MSFMPKGTQGHAMTSAGPPDISRPLAHRHEHLPAHDPNVASRWSDWGADSQPGRIGGSQAANGLMDVKDQCARDRHGAHGGLRTEAYL